jgi:acetamidase/formamidase
MMNARDNFNAVIVKSLKFYFMRLFIFTLIILISSCTENINQEIAVDEKQTPEAQYTLNSKQTHNKFSRSIPPMLRVESGAVIEIFTEEATDGQLHAGSTIADLATLSFDPIHPLTGPVYVEGAEPGDVLAVTLHKIEIGDWGWTAIIPGFGFLAEDFPDAYLKTYTFNKADKQIQFNEHIQLPVKPFAGVLGVAPDTDSLLSTIPPRANGGNMDDPNMTEGTTVYLPVFVPGALFSIGDAHVTQGKGEVCGSAVEAPMRFIVELNLIKGNRKIPEPQYETDEYYATTGFDTTIDGATKKAVRYMIDYLVEVHGMERQEAYVLCSVAADLHIAEVVDVPNMLVTMHISKSLFSDPKHYAMMKK